MDDNDDVLGTALAARWGSSPQPSIVCPTSSRVVMADDTQATVNAQLTIKESPFSQPVYQRESLWPPKKISDLCEGTFSKRRYVLGGVGAWQPSVDPSRRGRAASSDGPSSSRHVWPGRRRC